MNTVKVPTGRQDCSKSLAGNSSCFFFPAEFPDINHGVRKDFDVIIDNLLPNDVTLPQSLHDWQQTKKQRLMYKLRWKQFIRCINNELGTNI